MKYIFSSLVVIGILAGCSNSKPAENTSETPPTVQPVVTPVNPPAAPATTMALPSFSMLNALNQVIDLRQFAGKKVFVNLWATWCPPCRAEIPSIESLAAKTDKSKVEFVMLSLDDNFAKATAYASKNNMKLPVYYPAANLPPLFTVDGIPVTFIFNEKGEIIYEQVGTANYDTPAFLEMLNK